jgi:hypothetical protein
LQFHPVLYEGGVMENRERDRVSQRTSSTDAGELNRSVEERAGRDNNSGTGAEFGQSIGRSEHLEGGEMENRNKNQDNVSGNSGSMENESGRRSGQGNYGSSSGRSSGSMGGSNISSGSQSGNRSSTGELGSTGSRSGSSGSRGDSSEGRH